MVIYKILNIINGKCYIGQTKRGIERRWKGHCNSAVNNKSNNLFHNAINKYGKDAFSYEILDYANSSDELDKLEKQYIHEYATLHPNGYNTKTGGKCPRYSKLSKDRMSKAKKGRTIPVETRNKMSESHKKRWEDPLLREERSKQSKIIWENESYRENISTIRKEYWSHPDNRIKASIYAKQFLNSEKVKTKISNGVRKALTRKKVIDNIKTATERQKKKIIDSNGKIYNSLSDAAVALGVNSSNICKVLKGQYKTCRGLSFRYLNPPKKKLYMVIGPSGSGKSWVCKQLIKKFNYIPFDSIDRKLHIDTMLRTSGPLLYDPVIGISTFIKRNEDKFDIIVVAIIEDFMTIKSRLLNRGGKVTKSLYKRYNIVGKRAKKYAEFSGTSKEVFIWLKNVI